MPRIADLFCGAGGAGMGLHRAGFEVIGFDIAPQPRYPFEFHQQDTLTVDLSGFDAVWASPPCQLHTMAGQQWRRAGVEYPDLIEPTRRRLMATGKPYIIENVPRAPLVSPIILNGAMFGMRIRRTRLFECSFDPPFFLIPREGKSSFRMDRIPTDIITPVGHFSGVAMAQNEMGIDWMTRKELSQAIPPAYSEFLGLQLMRVLLNPQETSCAHN